MEQIGQRDDSSDRVDRCPQMRIFSGPLSMFGAKVEIAAREKGIAFELIMVPFDMKRRYEPVLRIAAEVLRLRPLPENHRKSDAELSTLAQAMM